ncbi:hypothetical protein FB45DRAFT_1098316 [Roridomyces roridus]|uniref:F-box domain-containing protein n=1 Tax=Roridomyces roridus TaxID=1738132 RepID=A0AAD7FZD4_9AGAR|nr:hypothetical protein FB45DRAFT_1098316 [Roridomyces roridus]
MDNDGRSFVLPDPPEPPATLAYLVGSNYAPDGLEERIARTHIGELEKQAAYLESVMAVCARWHANLLQSLDSHKPILSPMRRLPNELLAKIFAAVVRVTFAPDPYWHRWKSSRYPWLLRRVCSRWNAVALSTQSLWSWLYLDLNATEPPAAWMNFLYDRAGASLWTIRISELKETRKTHDALDAALTHCERWQNLSMCLYSRSRLLFDITAIRGRLPSLESLRIHASVSEADIGVLAEKFSDTFTAPNLTAVCVQFDTRECHRPPFEFPWSQLTRLSITLRLQQEALRVLSQLSRIVELKVECADMPDEVVSPQSHITLPHLRMLELHRSRHDLFPPSPYPSLLNYLNTPSLEHLSTVDEADEDEVLTFITRSGCKESLKSFLLIRLSSRLNQDKVVDLVHEMPHLVELETSWIERVHSFTQALHSHWLAVRSTSRESLFSVCIVRIGCDVDVGPMEKDGLFITIRDAVKIESVVDSMFL